MGLGRGKMENNNQIQIIESKIFTIMDWIPTFQAQEIITLCSLLVTVLSMYFAYKTVKYSVNAKIFIEEKHAAYSKLQSLLGHTIRIISPLQYGVDFSSCKLKEIEDYIDESGSANLKADKNNILNQLQKNDLTKSEKDKILFPLYKNEKQKENALLDDLNNHFVQSYLYLSDKVIKDMEKIIEYLPNYRWYCNEHNRWTRAALERKYADKTDEIINLRLDLARDMRSELKST